MRRGDSEVTTLYNFNTCLGTHWINYKNRVFIWLDEMNRRASHWLNNENMSQCSSIQHGLALTDLTMRMGGGEIIWFYVFNNSLQFYCLNVNIRQWDDTVIRF